MGKPDKVFGPFLPSEEGTFPCLPPPPPPPLVYPEDSPYEAWDALRLHLGMTVQQAGFDLNLPVDATAAAVSAFHAVFPRYFSKEELENRPTCVSRCMAACLFFAGKSSESSLRLREAVNCIEFLHWKLKKTFIQGEKTSTGADDGTREKKGATKSQERDSAESVRCDRSHSEVTGDEGDESGSSSKKVDGENEVKQQQETNGPEDRKETDEQRKDENRGEGEKGVEENKNKKKGRPFSRSGKAAVPPPAFLDGYTPVGILDYWKLRHECLLEEQRLCQALGFYLELPLLQDVVLEAQLLLLFSHREAHLYWAIINDIAATPLMTQFTLPILLAAGAICTKKLARQFAQEEKEENTEGKANSEDEIRTERNNEIGKDEGKEGQHEESEGGASLSSCVLRTKIDDETGRRESNPSDLLSDDDEDEVGGDGKSGSMIWHEDTGDVLQRLRPLLEGSPEFWALFDAKNCSSASFTPDAKIGYVTEGAERSKSSAYGSSRTEGEAGGNEVKREERRRKRGKSQLYVHLAEVCSRLMAFYGVVVKFQKNWKGEMLL